MHFLQAINSDISVLIVCNKTGGTIKGDRKKKMVICLFLYNATQNGVHDINPWIREQKNIPLLGNWVHIVPIFLNYFLSIF